MALLKSSAVEGQVLAESGLIGLSLLLWLWIALYRRLRRAESDYAEERELAGFFKACEAMIIFALVSAIFGHALAAPSMGIPVLTAIGVGLSYHRSWLRGRAKESAAQELAV